MDENEQNKPTPEAAQVPETPEAAAPYPYVAMKKEPDAFPVTGIVTLTAQDYRTLCEERAEARVRLEIQRSKNQRQSAELQKAKEELDRTREALNAWRGEAELWRGRYYAVLAAKKEAQE